MKNQTSLHKKRAARGLQFVGGYMSEDVVERIDRIARLLDVSRAEAIRRCILEAKVVSKLSPKPGENQTETELTIAL